MLERLGCFINLSYFIVSSSILVPEQTSTNDTKPTWRRCFQLYSAIVNTEKQGTVERHFV